MNESGYLIRSVRIRENSVPYKIKFSSDFKTHNKCMQVNPFLQIKMMGINNSHVILDALLATIKVMEHKGEKKFPEYICNRLIFAKLSISVAIYKNNFSIWYVPDTDTEKAFTP